MTVQEFIKEVRAGEAPNFNLISVVDSDFGLKRITLPEEAALLSVFFEAKNYCFNIHFTNRNYCNKTLENYLVFLNKTNGSRAVITGNVPYRIQINNRIAKIANEC